MTEDTKQRVADRIERIEEPATLKMAQLSRELRAKGIDVVDLSLGEPDFDTPQHIKDAAKKAIDENWTHYTPVPGLLTLREAICRKFKRDNNLDYTPDQIVVSTGAKQSIANAVLSLVNEGDEVIIPAPYWVSYTSMVQMARGEKIMIPSGIETNFKITPAQLEEKITEKTRLFIFSSPCNPTGTFYTKDELEGFAKVFQRHPQVIVISDEIYEYINYEDKHASIAGFEGMKERTVTVNGMSKGYAMTGWRIGYIGAPAWIAKACTKLQGQWTSGTSSVSQKAAEAALDGDMKPTHAMQKSFEQRREFMKRELSAMEGIKVNNPGGAFYFFPDVSAYFGKSFGEIKINTANDLSMYLLNTAHVAVVDGAAFGGEKNLRISYANSEKNLAEGLKRFREALGKLN